MIDKALIHTHRWNILAAVLALMLLLVIGVRWWRGPQVQLETVLQRDFVQTVVASGRVETAHRVDIGAQITGTVLRVPVVEGQRVAQGDLLVELGSVELRALQSQAQGALVQAQARLRQLREVQAPVAEQSLRQAQASLDNARSTLRRNLDLLTKAFISEAAVDESRKSVVLAEAQVLVARSQLAAAYPSGSDHALAAAAVAESSASADVARARAAYTAIRAPLTGILINRDVEVGDVVQPGKVLMILSPAGRTQLRVDIDEKNLRLLALGQEALASADAYPTQRFAAQLAFINPGVNVQTGAVEIKLDVPAPPAVQRQDMTVSVDIAVARRPNAILVSAAAVYDADGIAPWVLLADAGVARHQALRIGLNSGGLIEVLAGLKAGDQVLPVSAAVAAGQRFRAVLPMAKAPGK